jgi:hypothetical protein
MKRGQKYGLGRLHAADPDDNKYLMVRKLGAVGEPMPTKKTWSIRPSAMDQGNTGTCVAHAWCNFLRAAPIQSNKGIDQLRWEIYDWAILHDEWTDNDSDTERQFGTSVRAGAKAVTNIGRLESYLWAFRLQPALEWVLTQGPVVLGTNWYSSFWRPVAEGILKISPSATVEGGHAYLWRGADTKRGLALCSNSWGDDWGKSGEFFLPLRDLERLILEQGEVCVAVESKVRPK